jgi:hypothetical protein
MVTSLDEASSQAMQSCTFISDLARTVTPSTTIADNFSAHTSGLRLFGGNLSKLEIGSHQQRIARYIGAAVPEGGLTLSSDSGRCGSAWQICWIALTGAHSYA